MSEVIPQSKTMPDLDFIRQEIEHIRVQVGRQRKEITQLQRAGIIYYGDKPVEYEDTWFNPFQNTGVYFGCRASDVSWKEIGQLAEQANPSVEVFAGRKSERQFSVEFEQIA